VADVADVADESAAMREHTPPPDQGPGVQTPETPEAPSLATGARAGAETSVVRNEVKPAHNADWALPKGARGRRARGNGEARP
jgi:hypothetical protein